MTTKLLFANPTFYKDTPNATVRLGDKWLKTYNELRHKECSQIDLGPPTVELAQTDREGVVIGKARIEAAVYLRFYAIPQTLLDLEHDNSCRTLLGLYNEMKRVYGNAFDMSSFVTVIVFVPDVYYSPTPIVDFEGVPAHGGHLALFTHPYPLFNNDNAFVGTSNDYLPDIAPRDPLSSSAELNVAPPSGNIK